MKSSHYYKLLVFALSLIATDALAAGFGDIPASLALPAGTSVRRNAGNTLFESYTPATPGGSNTYVQFNDSGVFGGDSGLVFDKAANNLTVLGDVTCQNIIANNFPSALVLTGEVTGSGTTAITTTQTHFATFDIDGVGIVLSTGTKNPWKAKYGGTLVAWSAMCVPSTGGTCSVSFDLLRAANAAGLPTVSMVGAGTKPLISADVEASGTTFPSWTSTSISAGDNLAISLSNITTAKYAEITFWWK